MAKAANQSATFIDNVYDSLESTLTMPPQSEFNNTSQSSKQYIEHTNHEESCNYNDSDHNVSELLPDDGPIIEIQNNDCKVGIATELAQWAIQENITLTSLRKLLTILKDCCYEDLSSLPRDPRTLLKTPTTIKTRNLASGKYFYFGIQNSVNDMFATYDLTEMEGLSCIEIALNINGLPLAKSSGESFWPILCLIENIEVLKKKVFVVVIFQGTQKPLANEFLLDFITESIGLVTSGIRIGTSILDFKIKMLICDSPAKSHILAVNSFKCNICILNLVL